MSGPPLRLKVLESIMDVEAPAWDALQEQPPPFVRHAWIAAFEQSGSATRRTGWQPRHLTLWRGERLVAAAPAYLKFHSMGEYIYDFGWADAAARMGIGYYPKLLVAVPLSPATAPRFLIAPGEDRPALSRALREAAIAVGKEQGCSSVHVLYPPEEDAAELERAGFSRRLSLQFHWKNPGYRTFDDYLARFDSKRRHQLKRERAAPREQGIEIRTLRGAELGPAHAALAYTFYEATNAKNSWGRIQLNADFFQRVFRALPEAVEMVEALRGGKAIAGAFNLIHQDRLYGRYWGCTEEHPFLHFNVCLYHSIAECIELGRRVFEPGAGGEHKIPRGFEPSAIHSAHLIFDPRLAQAVRHFTERERAEHQRVIAESAEIAGMKPWTPPAAPSP